MPEQLQLNAAQANALVQVLVEHNDGEPVLFTVQGDGSVVVAFNLATATIATSGEVEVD